MRVFSTRFFNKFAINNSLSKRVLLKSVEEIENGNIDANLGGGVYKQRVGRPRLGKRGGVRVIIAINIRDKAFFLYGFNKNDKENLTRNEILAYKKLAKEMLKFTDSEIQKNLDKGELIEIKNEGK